MSGEPRVVVLGGTSMTRLVSAIPVVTEQTGRAVVQVDVLQVTDADLDALPDDPLDRLHVQSHAWAASTATGLTLSVKELPPLQVAVAEPGPIIAMKLQSIMNRGAAKEGTDLLDIVRITLDRSCGPTSWVQLRAADQGLRADALLHARRWFHEAGDRSLKKIRAVPEGRDLDLDDVRLVGDLLVAALTAGESAPVESDDVEQ